MDLTVFLRGILRQLLEDGAITGEQYGSMLRCLEKREDCLRISGELSIEKGKEKEGAIQ